MKKLFMALLALSCSGQALADIQFKIETSMGSSSTVSSNGQKARIDDGQMPGRVIIDYQAGQIFMVDPRQREVLRVSLQGEAVADDEVMLSLEDKGGGQKIAGYQTRKYQLLAGGQNCGTVYASKKLLQHGAVQGMFEAMRKMQNMSRGMMGGMGSFSSLLTECQRANMQLTDVVESAGAPMKVVDENGNTVSEIVAVDLDVMLPADYYALPAGMRVVDMNEKMNSALQQGQQMMQQMPQMNELMQQLQKSGGEMTDDVQQQLQQMMQQLQQQQQ